MILILWYLSTQFHDSFMALDDALSATLKAFEHAAEHSDALLE